MTWFFALSSTCGSLMEGDIVLSLLDDLIYMPLAPLPTKVMASLFIEVAARVPRSARTSASSAEDVTVEVPAGLVKTAALPRRVTLNWGEDEMISVLVLWPPMPKWVVPRPVSDAIYMALLLSRIRRCAMTSTTIVLVTSMASTSSANVGIVYAQPLEGGRLRSVPST